MLVSLEKAGLGKVPGAGEWKELELAKAAAETATEADGGGVRWLGLAGPGDVETLFGRDFLFFFVVDLGFAGWDPGAGLPLLDFMGVAG